MKSFRGRKGRIFHHGGLKWIVLSLLDKESTHGYGLIRTIETLCAGAYTPSPGVVYPALNMLEDQGFITNSVDDAGRKNYAITELGRDELNHHQDELAMTLKRLERLGEGHDGLEQQDLVRSSLHNIKRLLKQNLVNASCSDTQVEQVKAILQKTERDIEAMFSAHSSQKAMR